ncbi:MAG TPA: hypothetical protein VIM65_11370 [Cyclobacteriaceae bacterium]
MFIRNFIIVLALLLLFSCKEVSFKAAQPKDKKGLTSVPEELCGNYVIPNEEGKIEDTLFVTALGYKLGHNPDDAAFLSDSLVLKFYKGYYFLNINKRPEWFLRVIQQEKNGDIAYMAMEQQDESFSDYLERVSFEVEIDSTSSTTEKLYLINPTPKQLLELIQKGFFKKTILKKIR